MIQKKKGRPKKPKFADKVFNNKVNFGDFYDIINTYRDSLLDKLDDEEITYEQKIYIEEFFKLETYQQNILILRTEFGQTKLLAKLLKLDDFQDDITYIILNTKKLLKKRCQEKLLQH